MTETVNMIVKAYIEVYGVEKWNSLTEQEQHDVIMIIAKDAVSQM